MADFVAILKKTIDGLSDNTPAMREKVYRKARDTVAAKLAAIDPPPSRIVVERQHKALEDAVKAVEASYSSRLDAPDDFESVLAGLEQKPAKPQIAEPGFAGVETAPPAEPAGHGAKAAVPQEEAPAEPVAPVAGEVDADASKSLTPIAPVRRPEPTLVRPLAGDRTPPSETPPAIDNNRRRVSGAMIAALLAVVVIAAGGYGIWLNRAEFGNLFGMGGGTAAVEEQSSEPAPAAEAPAEPDTVEPAEQEMAAAPAEQPAAPAAPAEQPAAEENVVKFTQRLTENGQEIDEGPAGGPASIGEGTSLATATQVAEAAPVEQPGPAVGGATDAAEQPAAEGEQAVPVGQRAIFYEERTNVAEGSAENGTTIWSLVQESPGGDLPPEPAIRAEVTVPGKDVQLRMTIRRNGDKTLPASHIVEMIFLTSGTFEGGGIDSVLRIALKNSEAAPGNPLVGMPARIADGYFLVALSDGQAEQEQNMQLLLRQSWIDIPIVYRSGRRALVTMEKGVPGERVFQEAMQAWQNASSG
jgi:hypothetical protein